MCGCVQVETEARLADEVEAEACSTKKIRQQSMEALCALLEAVEALQRRETLRLLEPVQLATDRAIIKAHRAAVTAAQAAAKQPFLLEVRIIFRRIAQAAVAAVLR